MDELQNKLEILLTLSRPGTDVHEVMLEAIPAFARLRRIEKAAEGLVEYRRSAGPLNFQLEKADDFINAMRIALGGE